MTTPIRLPYSRQDINEADIAAVTAVLRGDWLTQGPAVPAFEAAFAQAHQGPHALMPVAQISHDHQALAQSLHDRLPHDQQQEQPSQDHPLHAVAVSNATAALHLACVALGVGPGDRVWTSPISFVASANCARYCGAAVDFVDIDPDTRNLSVAALTEKLAAAERRGTLPKVVIPVHFAGLPCDLREMRALADRYGFALLADGSHATGAMHEGTPVGSRWVHATVFSFHAVKIVTTGEGGLVLTADAALAEHLRLLRSHGITRDPAKFADQAPGAWRYEQQTLGYNARMTDLQAALGLSQLHRLRAMHAARIALADRYDELLAGLPLLLPARVADRVSAWHLYCVEIDEPVAGQGNDLRRDQIHARHRDHGDVRHLDHAEEQPIAWRRRAVFDAMRAAGIGVNVHYPAIHLQPYYRALGFAEGDFPNAERYAAGTLSLPLYPALTEAEQGTVVAALEVALS